ncbi:MAG TPA: hypothetical protein DCF68_22100 [Cyanothece sp. UBA12306]|nr:hypothetical protein [Cyanothece sp. UBA12306]
MKSTIFRAKILYRCLLFLIFSTTIWIAHFLNSSSFGLYEDDYYRISEVFDMNWLELVNCILQRSNSQGRPLHDGFQYLLSFLGFKIAGLQGIYFLAFTVVIANCFLFYFILRQLSSSFIFAVSGTFAFALFPADTTKILLTHSFGIQTSITFLLIAIFLYLIDKKYISYIFIFLTLLTYETLFPVFLAVPLLKSKWDSKLIKELLINAAIMAGLVTSIIIARKLSIGGLGVIKEPNYLSIILWSLKNQLFGPIFAMLMFLYRPWQVILFLKNELNLILFISWLLLAYLFLITCYKDSFEQNRNNKLSTDYLHLVKNKKKLINHFSKLIITGYIFLVLSYALTLTESFTSVSGRASRVHSSAIFGASIIIASICALLVFMINSYRKRSLTAISLAFFFTLLIGFGIIVQKDYQRSWHEQQIFWTDVIHFAPDLQDGTVVLVDGSLPHNNEQIFSFSWSMPYLLERIYSFPKHWKMMPRLYLLKYEWETKIISNGKFLLNNENGALNSYFPWEQARLVESSDIILLNSRDGRIIQRKNMIIINEKKYSFKKDNSQDYLTPKYNQGSLYKYIIKPALKNPVRKR